MPKEAALHIEMHKQLEKAVNQMIATGQKTQIPENVISTLNKSRDVVRIISTKVNYTAFLKLINKDETTYTDSSRLLTSLNPENAPRHSNMKQWELNFGLLYSAYQRTNDEDTKATIRFLMTNYLAKAAFLNSGPVVNLSDEDMKSYEEYAAIGPDELSWHVSSHCRYHGTYLAIS